MSYNVVNAMQVPLLTFPHLAARHGGAKTAAALANAYKSVGRAPIKKLIATGGTLKGLRGLLSGADFNSAEYDVIDDVLGAAADPMHRKLLKTLVEHNAIDVSMASDMAQGGMRSHVNPDGTAKAQTRLNYLTEWMRMAPHITEVLNRSVTAVASFDLEYAHQIKAGKSPSVAEKIATDYAMAAIEDTQFLYSEWNKPRVLQGQTRRVVLMFKQYSMQMYYYLISRAIRSSKGLTAKMTGKTLTAAESADAAEATRSLLWLAGIHLMAVGAIGATPEPIKFLLYLVQLAVGQFTDNEEPFNFELMVKSAMGDWLGPTLGHVASTGLPALVGMDLSSRVGLDSMLMFNTPDLSTKDTFLASTARIAGGPMLSLAERLVVDFPAYVAKGNWSKAIEAATPKVFRDPIKAMRLHDQGFTTFGGNRYGSPDMLSPWDYGQIMLGFTPRKVSTMYTKRSVMRSDYSMRNKRSAFYDRVFIAYRAGEDLRPILKDIASWNKGNPVYAIHRMDIIRSIKGRIKSEISTQNNIVAPKSSMGYLLGKIKNL